MSLQHEHGCITRHQKDNAMQDWTSCRSNGTHSCHTKSALQLAKCPHSASIMLAVMVLQNIRLEIFSFWWRFKKINMKRIRPPGENVCINNKINNMPTALSEIKIEQERWTWKDYKDWIHKVIGSGAERHETQTSGKVKKASGTSNVSQLGSLKKENTSRQNVSGTLVPTHNTYQTKE